MHDCYSLAMHDDATAQHKLAVYHLTGDIKQRNPIEAAGQGLASAQGLLGALYMTGLGVEKNLFEASTWFRKAAEQGHVAAQLQLGHFYITGVVDGLPLDLVEAVRWYRLAAHRGDANAQTQLGCCYRDGTGVHQDATEALQWFRLAALQDNVDALYNLGHCFALDIGVECDVSVAIRWFRRAAEQGFVPAQVGLGLCLCQSGNSTEAFEWFQRATEAGSTAGQYLLSRCYRHGDSIERDIVKAFYWLRLAAEHDLVQFDLGRCYELGESRAGTEPNRSEAGRWYRQAAEQGYAPAQNALKRLEQCHNVLEVKQ